MKAGSACVDGVVTDLANAKLPVWDEAFLSGWTVFETLRVENGVPLYLDRHLLRLERSAASAEVPMPKWKRLMEEVEEVLQGWLSLGRLRITLTGSGRRVVTVEPLDPAVVNGPVRVSMALGAWDPALGPTVKHGNRMGWNLLLKRSGGDDLLLTDSKVLVESVRGAVWAVIDGELWTPPEDQRSLPSISRAVIVERAQRLGIGVRRDYPPLQGWDALYISSSVRDLCPVVELDGRPLSGLERIGRALSVGVVQP